MANEDFSDIPDDIDYLLTLVSATAAAVMLGERTMADRAIPLLAPYSGRGVVNAGGVLFVGVVDDYLRQACTLLGRDDETRLYGQQAGRAWPDARLWWLRRVQAARPADSLAVRPAPSVLHIRPRETVSGGSVPMMARLRYAT